MAGSGLLCPVLARREKRPFVSKTRAGRAVTIQALVSDYDLDKLRLNAEMAVRFATTLEITTD
jgi:hypothetical protein